MPTNFDTQGSGQLPGFLQRTKNIGNTLGSGFNNLMNGVNGVRNFLQKDYTQQQPTQAVSGGFDPARHNANSEAIYNTQNKQGTNSGVGPFANASAYSSALGSNPGMIDVNKAHNDVISATKDKLQSAKDQLSQAQGAGYSGNQQIQYDSSGKMISTNPTTTTSTGTPTPSNYTTQNPPTVGSIASQEANVLNNPSPQIQQARQAIVDLKNEYAKKGVNIDQTAGFLTQANGEQGLLQRQYLTALDAANTNLNSALTSQGQGITALGQAGTQVAPQAGNALGYYNPVTNQTTGYNAPGGSFGGGQVLGNLNLGQQYQQTLAPSYNAANSVLNGLNGFLNKNPDINPSNVNFVNEVNAWAQGKQLSNPKYPELTQYLNEFLNTLTPLIGSAGQVTNYKQQIVDAMINPTSSTGSLQQQLSNLFNNIATKKLQAIAQTGQQTSTNLTPTGGTNYTFGNFY